MNSEKPKKSGTKAIKTIEIILFVAFLFFGMAKLFVSPEKAVDVFGKIGGSPAQYTTAFYQIIAAILVIMPKTAFIGAILMAISMAVAIILHFIVLGFTGPFLILTILAFAILLLTIYVMAKRRRYLFK